MANSHFLSVARFLHCSAFCSFLHWWFLCVLPESLVPSPWAESRAGSAEQAALSSGPCSVCSCWAGTENSRFKGSSGTDPLFSNSMSVPGGLSFVSLKKKPCQTSFCFKCSQRTRNKAFDCLTQTQLPLKINSFSNLWMWTPYQRPGSLISLDHSLSKCWRQWSV